MLSWSILIVFLLVVWILLGCCLGLRLVWLLGCAVGCWFPEVAAVSIASDGCACLVNPVLVRLVVAFEWNMTVSFGLLQSEHFQVGPGCISRWVPAQSKSYNIAVL